MSNTLQDAEAPTMVIPRNELNAATAAYARRHGLPGKHRARWSPLSDHAATSYVPRHAEDAS